MSFNSYIFVLLFLPICIIGWYLFNRFTNKKVAIIFICLMSLCFCGYVNYLYAVAVSASIIINYFIAYLIRGCQKREKGIASKTVFIIGIILNILALGYFKYSHFFVDTINDVFRTDFVVGKIILPLGISFYTFSQISFLFDVYRKDIKGYCSFLDYALFILYFPKLSMGPITRYNDFVSQINEKTFKTVDWDALGYGAYMFIMGLSKKVLIADTFGAAVDWAYSSVEQLNTIEIVLTILFYTIQIYFDFSGYSDMAIGISRMLNINLPMNFNVPYRAITIVDFWDRWHITLSKFFTKYLYIPMGGNRKGKFRTYLNVMVVFLASGLWHGASVTFILWGGAHGLFVVFTKAFKKFFDKVPKAINWMITFAFVNLTWILFRAGNISNFKQMLTGLFRFNIHGVSNEIWNSFRLPEYLYVEEVLGIKGIPYQGYIPMLVFIIISCVLMFFAKGIQTEERFKRFKPSVKTAIVSGVLLFWCVISFSGITSYVYLNF